jgi:hypothetical protein
MVANFHGTQRKNDTEQSTTDPDAKVYRKSSNAESKLSCLGHTLGSDTAGRFHARVRGSFSGNAADGGCVAQFGDPGSGPSQRQTVEIAAREMLGHHRDFGAPVRCQPLEPDTVDCLNCRIVIYIDDQRFGAHHIISAVGMDREGRKHILSLEAGATENAAAGSSRRRHRI